jgi:hypothetical protein
MSRVNFVDTDYIKEYTTIQDNVDDDILVPFILISQDTHLQRALGTTFYDRLKQGVIDTNSVPTGSNPLNANERALILDYVQPMIAQWTFYEALPHINYKFTNKAVSKERSEYSDSSQLDEVKYLRNGIRDLAEFYTARLIKHLCDYSSNFPEYENPDSKENLHKSNRAYFGGVVIPKRGKSDYDKYHKKYV